MTLQEMYINKNVYIDDMDCILVDYELFFDKELGKYNCFSVDDENELNEIREFCQRLIQLGSKIYVFAYNENVDSLGKEYIYADCLWVDTTLSIKDLNVFFEQYKNVEPSDISLIKETGEYNQRNLYLFRLSGEIVKLKEIIDETHFDNIKSLYWD